MIKQSIQSQKRFSSIQPGAIALLLLTAGAHLYLGTQPDEELHFWFLLNGLGYLVLLAPFLLPQLGTIHAATRKVLAGYTILTILLWVFLGSPAEGRFDPFDVLVKAIEVLLVVLLMLEERTAAQQQVMVKQAVLVRERRG
ncbi:hypothetical protein KSF_084540 [Reticulibacter mediterranei]|uniref:DUF2069 domain-containing protein n=1 Tax=Reticulibacter mediterranei TaxID=2778369 RepID=A0A8J3J040_9CHLR|nr:hypothetical protein [Reticulibacter mediterranei]GHO98406.1 hypothetical protein KSF_084540 [Reticulibacter mediterranei]